MLLVDLYKIPIGRSLGKIALILARSVVASLLRPREAEPSEETAAVPEQKRPTRSTVV